MFLPGDEWRRVDEKSKPNMFREGPRKVNFALPSAPTANTDQVPYWYSRSLPPSAVAEPQQAQTTPANPEPGSAVAVPQQAQPTQVPQPSTPNNASAPGWSSNYDWWGSPPPKGARIDRRATGMTPPRATPEKVANGMQDGVQDRVDMKVGGHDN